jgi:hypothetical protein
VLLGHRLCSRISLHHAWGACLNAAEFVGFLVHVAAATSPSDEPPGEEK